MANQPVLLDHRGNPIRRSVLTKEVAAPTIGGVRSPITGYPGDGLTPQRLAAILREADQGDPIRYLELAETIEERDPHYLGVLGTRRRSVSQLDITVEEGGDTPLDKEIAERLRQWLKRDELTNELFHILDAIGKGYSATEMIWDRSMGQWSIAELKFRDPRWFGFDRTDLDTPMLRDEHGQLEPLPGGKFIFARMAAKSGITPRSGLARVAMWGYLFKKFTERDWGIFCQTYGQPIRLGRYPSGATEEEQTKLYRAVVNIAGDCAAIIPEGTNIEFQHAAQGASTVDLFERRADWYDKQTSKAVLGQTATTDAETGGLGSGKEHRQVQEDIERADAIMLSAIINRDLVRPFVHLNWPGHPRMPMVKIARPETEDLVRFSDAIAPFIDRGLPVDQAEVLAKFGLSQPAEGSKILSPVRQNGAQPDLAAAHRAAMASQIAVKHPFNTQGGSGRPDIAAAPSSVSRGLSGVLPPAMDLLASEGADAMAPIFEQIEAMIGAAGDLDELKTMLSAAFPELQGEALVEVLGAAMTASVAGGMLSVATGDPDG